MPSCVPWDIDSACCDGFDDLDPALVERSTELAWSTLKALTGGRVGSCPVTVRPCLTRPCSACMTEWRPHIFNGEWVNDICGTPRCSCTRMCEIVLEGEVAELQEVLLDGLTLDASLFRVDNGNRVVRQDGECWPSCQDLGLPLGDPDTLGITYVPGIVPGAAGEWAAGVLTCEFTKACTGAKCRLPSSVSVVTRPGITYETNLGMFPGGMVGIREVDAFVYSVNPHGLKTPPRVWSPDVPWSGHRYQSA